MRRSKKTPEDDVAHAVDVTGLRVDIAQKDDGHADTEAEFVRGYARWTQLVEISYREHVRRVVGANFVDALYDHSGLVGAHGVR